MICELFEKECVPEKCEYYRAGTCKPTWICGKCYHVNAHGETCGCCGNRRVKAEEHDRVKAMEEKAQQYQAMFEVC